MSFNTAYDAILDQIEAIDPIKYASSRNFVDGAVTRLSPFISRGVISTKQVFESILNRGYDFDQATKFIQELAWRDYWQQVWVHRGDDIDRDLKHEQPDVGHYEMPTALRDASTGIEEIDKGITELYETGYMHNHMRMYVASIACNMGKSHWSIPAKWMYYHLLDADWASNALSWQWVAGANSNKKYFANQENVNKYFHSSQRNTFMDVEYDAFASFSTPSVLKTTSIPNLIVNLPNNGQLHVDSNKPTCIYNFYNMDPNWRQEMDANRILLLEPTHFDRFPVSPKTIDFLLQLSNNIQGIQVYVGSFDDLVANHALKDTYYKEHPLNGHYRGTEDPRDWMFGVKGYFPSFFAFWKKCQKEFKKTRAEG